ncbi:MAG: ATP-dependent helicase [Patescibacteria group bacterium]|nr:ATP-dependent helicase [Patescibacteria group bacterium]
MSFDLAQLNQEQLQAVKAQDKIVVVKAGPGTGKTHTLTSKLLLLLENGIDPDKVVALTFTQRAAQEMKERLTSNLSLESRKPFVGTFHAFALKKLGISSEAIVSDSQRRKILLQTKIDLGHSQIKLKDLDLIITQTKNKALPVSPECQVEKTLSIYQKHLKNLKKFDYDDLLLKLKEQTERYKDIDYLLIDEFQDLNKLQLSIIDCLLSHLKQLFVIGDVNQAIYGFRGAQAKGFEKWAIKLSNAVIVKLKKNYRSDRKIIEASASLFLDEEQLEPISKKDGEVKLIKTLNQFTEAKFIRENIEEKLGGIGLAQASEYHQAKETKFSNFAIAYRTKFLGRQIKAELDQAGIPVQQVGTDSIYLQPEVIFLVNLIWWNVLIKGKDEINISLEEVEDNLLQSLFLQLSLKTIIKFETLKKESKQTCLIKLLPLLIADSNLSKNQQEAVQKFIAILHALESNRIEEDLIQLAERITGLLRAQFNLKDSQLKNIYQFKANLLSFSSEEDQFKLFHQYLHELQLRDYYEHQADRVSLLTMHAAKGLEFDWVYLIGFEEGQIPFIKNDGFKRLSEKDLIEEEKRLLYVAMTRAKKGLFLLKPAYRWKKKTADSQFFSLIKNKIKVMTDKSLIRFSKKQKENELRSRQSSLF